MVMEIHGTYKLTYHPVEGDSEKAFEVDFTPPFRRVKMIPELEKQLNVTFPPATEFHSPGGATYIYCCILILPYRASQLVLCTFILMIQCT